MRCDHARRLLSDRVDEALGDTDESALVRHLDRCHDCRAYDAGLAGVRRALHLQPVGAAPDLVPRVRAALEAQRAATTPRLAYPSARRGDRGVMAAAAASFLVAVVVAASLVGLVVPPDARATDVSALVLDGQTALQSLHAGVEVVEHGWHPDVPERRYSGGLRYHAPETLALELRDRTDYPAGPWRANDVTLVVDDAEAWGSGLPPCPPAALPGCTSPSPRVEVYRGRAPFDAAAPVPLDLVLPVASFGIGGAEQPLGEKTIGDRDTVGVGVSAAQIAPFLDGLARYGNWRPIHPTDPAEVWLDVESGLPLVIEVRAGSGYERDRWAAANDLDEAAGAPVLSWRLHDIDLTPDPWDPPGPPPGTPQRELGFVDGAAAGPAPAWLPEGMTLHRAGRAGEVFVASYVDGRAWLAVHTTGDWQGRRLFGHDSSVVRFVDLGDDGVAYVPEGGDRVLLHGEDLDVEVVGSLPTDDLVRVAVSLGVTGRSVPADWIEAGSSSLTAARAALPGLLALPEPHEGWIGPGVAVTERGVVQSYSGAGDRTFVLSEVPGDTLGPPLDAIVLTVDVRGQRARYTPDRGTLEWVENGRIVTLRSRTLGLAALTDLGAALEGGT